MRPARRMTSSRLTWVWWRRTGAHRHLLRARLEYLGEIAEGLEGVGLAVERGFCENA